jgi:Polyferredoxin
MREGKRHLIQALTALAYNAHLPGFANAKIWQGGSKRVCVPGLNCYSCPGALGACPVGSLQAAISGSRPSFPYYVVGMLAAFGVLFGRLVCGFLCPFGLVQELLHRLPGKKAAVPPRLDRPLRGGKYAVLAVLVILLPLLARGPYGVGDPWFCKYVCPAGTLEGGIPLLAGDAGLRGLAGALFSWKLGVLIAVLAASGALYRPFCKYLCPLGALYGLFNRVSFCRMEVDRSRCTGCGNCARACPMQVDVLRNINSAECIRCGACADACGSEAVRWRFGGAGRIDEKKEAT